MPVNTKHPEYTLYKDKWQLFHDCFYGEGGFEDGTYLIPHPVEIDLATVTPAYLQRRKIAYYLNYCAYVIESKNSHLYKSTISRNFTNDDLQKWSSNVDGKGTSLHEFMKMVQRDASIFGHLFVFMDRPDSPELKAKMETTGVVTRADEQKAGVVPYLYTVSPLEVLDWSADRQGNLEWVKVSEKLYVYDGDVNNPATPTSTREVKDFVRVWTRDAMMLHQIGGETEDIPVQMMVHGLGRVPCVVVYNKRGKERELSGKSEIWDLSGVNKRLYNACSELDEWIRNQAFSILTYPVMPDDKNIDKIGVGSSRGLPFNGESSQSPNFISADAAHADAMMKNIDKLIEECQRLSHMKFKGGVAQSGVGWAFDWEEVNNSLADLARSMEKAERGIAELYMRWQNPLLKEITDAGLAVNYPETFSYADEEVETTVVRNFLISPIPSSTLAREWMRDRSRRLLPNATPEIMEEIDGELDNWDPVQDREDAKNVESGFSAPGAAGPKPQPRSEKKRLKDGQEPPPSKQSDKGNDGGKKKQ